MTTPTTLPQPSFSPDELDARLRVTSPKSWLGLSALAAVVLAFVAWSAASSVPKQVKASGVLIWQHGLQHATARTSGLVRAVHVNIGQTVKQGDLIMEIEDLDLRVDLETAQEVLTALQNAKTRLQTAWTSRLQSSEAAATKQLEALGKTIQEEQVRYQELVQVLADRKPAPDGAEADTLKKLQVSLASYIELINRLQTQHDTLADQDDALEQESRNEISAADARIQEQTSKVTALQARWDSLTRVESPVAGKIVELLASGGSLVTAGDALARVQPTESTDRDLRAAAFLPYESASQVQAGMLAEVAPASVPEEEYGYIVGQVATVNDFPATRDGMIHLLGDDRLVDYLLEGGPVVYAEIVLEEDSTAPSGYRWTTGSGPESLIHGGVPCQVTVTTQSQRPIQLLLPLFE